MIVGVSGYKTSGKSTIAKMWRFCHYQPYGMPDWDDLYEAYTESAGEYGDIEMDGWWSIVSWATPLKRILSQLTGIPVLDMEDEDVKNSYLPKEWDTWSVKYDGFLLAGAGRCDLFRSQGDAVTWAEEHIPKGRDYKTEMVRTTLRTALQFLGTDLLRNNFHPQVHINATMRHYTPDKESEYYDKEAQVANHPPGHLFTKGMTFGVDPRCYPDWIMPDTRFENEAEKCDIMIRVNAPYRTTFRDPIDDELIVTYSKERQAELFEKMMDGDCSWYVENAAVDKHASETALDDYKFDYVIENNGTEEDLLTKVKTLYDRIQQSSI